jgi:hypothetical protein
MATPKTWTAVDIQTGPLQVWRDAAGTLHAERHYTFVDAEGAEIPVGQQLLSVIIPWDNVPLEIREALARMDAWTTDQILEQEGMQDQP